MAITVRDNLYVLELSTLSYAIRMNEEGLPTLLYFGRKLRDIDHYASLVRPLRNSVGTSLMSPEGRFPSREAYEFFMPNRDLKCEPSFLLSAMDGSGHYAYRFRAFEKRAPEPLKDLPFPSGRGEELVLSFEEVSGGSELSLHYVLFPDSDVLGRYAEVRNTGKEPLRLSRLSSLAFFLPDIGGYTLSSFHGAWANELHKETRPVPLGGTRLGTLSGSSSNATEPFFFLASKGANETSGEAYGFSLLYSGSHMALLEKDVHARLHLQMGIADTGFKKILSPGESFLTPMALLSYSDAGLEILSRHFHSYLEGHILPPYEGKNRPIVYNNWEATGMAFNERKIHALMGKAKEIGAELFVLDDGWFKNRKDDKRALGDWEVDRKKLPHGLEGLIRYAKKKGLSFGIWMEPEMISRESDLYGAHPDWVLRDAKHEPLEGRNQLLLDLRKKEVQDFVIESLTKILSIKGIRYLKWDYNRPFGATPHLLGSDGFDYMRGLYHVLAEVRRRFPKLLMENCASGGNRFDYGMMRYFNQSWLSDCTDSFERIRIQRNASYFFPLSVLSNHVSAKTNNQTLRKSPLESKFDVAAFGVLGYELDLNDLSPLERKVLRAQTAFYKKHRDVFQKGAFSRLETLDGMERGIERWQARYEKETIIGDFRGLSSLSTPEDPLVGRGFLEEKSYCVTNRPETISFLAFGHLVNMISPIHLAEEGALIQKLARHKGMDSERFEAHTEGVVLNGHGLPLGSEWAGTGLEEGTRMLGDFGARLYLIEEEGANE